MLHVWELGVDTAAFIDGHSTYAGPPRPAVFEFDHSQTVHENQNFDVMITTRPKGLIHSHDFKKSKFPGKQEYGHAVHMKTKEIIYQRVLLVPLSQETFLFICRKS